MKSLLKNNSIEIYSAQHERKTYVTSRFIRSLKEKIHIYIYIYTYIYICQCVQNIHNFNKFYVFFYSYIFELTHLKLAYIYI